MKNSCVHTRTRIFFGLYLRCKWYLRCKLYSPTVSGICVASYICGASGKIKSRHSPKKLVKNTCPYRPRGDIGNER